MGLFDAFLGKSKGAPVPSTDSAMPSSSVGDQYEESNTSKLLKQATEQKRSGNIIEAINTLKAAYSEAAVLQDIGLDAYLRLPMYYQEAGQSAEAWAVFTNLLKNGYAGQNKSPSLIPMDHSTIYDKMRLFLQREKRQPEAILFGIMSYVSWGAGLSRQKRSNELDRRKKKDVIVEMLTPLVKKAKCIEKLESLTQFTVRVLSQTPSPSMNDVEDELRTILDLTRRCS